MRVSRSARLGVVAAALALSYAVVIAVQAGTHIPEWIPFMVSWAVFALLSWWLLRRPDRPGARTVGLVVIALAAGVVQLPGLFAAPQMSSDAYRYVWDGRVQLAGVDPYRYVPLDDRLARLRDPVLFPGLGPDRRSGVSSPRGTLADLRKPVDLANRPEWTVMNRPMSPTLYPPVAEAWFTVVAAVTPDAAGTLGLQVSFLLVAVATTALIGWSLRRAGRDPLAAILYAGSPPVVIEAASNAHVDVLAAGLVVAAVVFAHRRWVAGLLIGAAASVKLTPLLLLPAFVGHRVRDTLATWSTALVTLVAGYLPHALVAGWLVVGYLPGYLDEEGYDSGRNRFKLLELIPGLSGRMLTVTAVALGLAVAVAVLIRAWRNSASSSSADPEAAVTATWLFGCALLIATPTYPWYVVPLVGLAVLSGRYEWFALAIASYAAYAYYRNSYLPGVFFAVAATVVALTTFRRRQHDRRDTVASPGKLTAVG